MSQVNLTKPFGSGQAAFVGEGREGGFQFQPELRWGI